MLPAPLRWLASLPVLIAATAVYLGGATGAAWWKVEDDGAVRQTREILGSDPSSWQFPAGSLTNVTVMGRPALRPTGAQVNLLSHTTYPSNMMYSAVFHADTREGKGGGIQLRFGCKNPVVGVSDPGVYVYAGPKVPYIGWWVYGTNSTYKAYSYYYLNGIKSRSLSWPETLRKSVEKDIASIPDSNDHWFQVRVIARPRSIETWLDDRLLDVRTDADRFDVAGGLNLGILPNTDLASFRATPLPPEDPVFRAVSIGGYLNASKLDDHPVRRESLPPPDSSVRVNDIPFVFPKPDARGNDHISLAGSWAQFSAREGYEESHHGEFGGRWPGALSHNPARNQLRLPYDNYVNLHLIVAADDSRDSVPVVTAQFFRTASGFPKSFTSRVPLFSARSTESTALPVKLENGREGSLHRVTIPLDPGELSTFSDLDVVELELTKEVRPYRSYPDPICYSAHQGGLPSSAHIYAMTLERAPVNLDFQPDKFGHVWTAPSKPAYTVKLRNHTTAPRTVELKLSTRSHDGTETNTISQSVTVPPGDTATVAKFPINDIKKYGHHAVSLEMKDGPQVWTENRSLAHLAPETREKGDWEDGRGPVLGFWAWGGGHHTPNLLQELAVMSEAGAETCLGDLSSTSHSAEERAFAEKQKMFTSLHFGAHSMYDIGFCSNPQMREKWDSGDRAVAETALMEALRKAEVKPTAVSRPIEVPFFPEPSIGAYTHGIPPEYYGDPDHTFSKDEETLYKRYEEMTLFGGRLIRKHWPNAKILLPWGDPLFCVPFIRRNAEIRALVDGVALDMPGFERMPEQQIHQVCHHRLYVLNEEFKKIGKKPFYAVHEGTCAPTPPGALSHDVQADIYARNFLIYFAYGVYRHPSGPTPFDCANYWGEEHYGCCGLFNRIPYCTPKPSYVAYATLSRHLNRANFEKWIPTGSLSTYCLQFKHHKTGKLTHVLWCIKGRRPVTLTIPSGVTVTHFDEDDNGTALAPTDGRATFSINSSPCYVEGLTADAQFSLGDPDHADASPSKDAVKLGNVGVSWRLEAKEDTDYADSYPLQVARFVGKMSAVREDAPAAQGGKALAVRLGQQEKERKVMPWYTTLVPDGSIQIPGKSSHIGLWVKAASDWGRVVYVLRDDKNEKWVSVGTKDQWNCDDTHQWSVFNFDGWRYLRFEMPSNLGYDSYRENGTTWWGHYGPGDGIVDLPLKLEKIIVERRTHAMYVNDPQPTRPDDVLLADLYAEYERPADKEDGVVRESRIRMRSPEGVPELENPIKAMADKGVGAPTKVTRVENPAHYYDGTRCHVFFDEVPGASRYDVWVSPYPDGNGALQLGTDWKKSGELIQGLRPDMDFHVFVVYTDKDGKPSKPSAPLKIRLKDLFGHK